jgi:hypothetical protein
MQCQWKIVMGLAFSERCPAVAIGWTVVSL